MDTFVDSSWYYMRFACADRKDAMVDDRVNYWLPVDQYIGGIEHAILHLLYSRFWTKVMRDLGLVKFGEPFTNLLTQGMVLNEIFSRKSENGRISYFNPAEVEIETDDNGKRVKATLRADGKPVESGGIGTMSKSKNNGVDPQSLIEEYGADTARLFMMFASPPEDTLVWNDAGVEGASRFLKRCWSFLHDNHAALQRESARHAGGHRYPADAAAFAPAALAARRDVHTILRQINHDFQRHQFNTVVSGAMKILNALQDMGAARAQPAGADGGDPREAEVRQAVVHEGISTLLRVLAPITPHFCHGAWVALGLGTDIMQAAWPEPDPQAMLAEEIELVLQVNGKLRGNMRVAKDADRALIEQLAMQNPGVQKHVSGQPVKKVIVVPGRLVNVVV